MIARRHSLFRMSRTLIVVAALSVIICTLLPAPATASPGGAGAGPRVTIVSPARGIWVDDPGAAWIGVAPGDLAVVVGTLEFHAYATSGTVRLRSCSMHEEGGPYAFLGWEPTVVKMSHRRHRCDLTGNPHGWGQGTLVVTAIDVLGRRVTARQDFLHVTLVPTPSD
jgi:hypothetical protein